jgi:hypothetical protein
MPRRAPADGRQKAASFDRLGERSSAFGGQKAARKSWPSTADPAFNRRDPDA